MKYTDEQRLRKIFDNARKLDNYIREKQENENNYKKPKNKEIINIDVDFNF